jgi:hypothetical protein
MRLISVAGPLTLLVAAELLGLTNAAWRVSACAPWSLAPWPGG